MDTSNVSGKVVVITGASSGIGEATARLLARRGARLALAARRADRLDALVRTIAAEGGQAIAVRTDVTNRDHASALIGSACEAYGCVDVVVNNAGIMPVAPFADLRVDEWNRMIDVNIKGVLNTVAAALPCMQRQQQGHIVNVASILGFKVFVPFGTVYCATKFAVRALSEGLRVELKPYNIRSTIVSPGVVATELPENSADETTRARLRDVYRIAISPDSVARAIVYAIEQPADVDINEVVIRPTAQEV